MGPKLILPLTLALLGSGCTLAPTYTRPDAPVPQAWKQPPAAPEGAVAAELPWSDFFTDPDLQSVLRLALANNRDLRVAALNVERMQALHRIQRSELLPSVGLLAEGQSYRRPESMDKDGKAVVVEQYSVNVGVLSWELDFFGRLRSMDARALNQYFATEQARVSAQISLVAGVAQAYWALAASREDLRLAQETFAAQKATYELILQSRDLGVASDLEYRQSQSQMELARADMARYRGQAAVAQNALDLLVGAPVPEALLPKGLDGAGEMTRLSGGLPSEVLLKRPDILMAEYQLQAAQANIGAARAAFFPRITLTAGAGTMSPELSGLFASGTRTWSFMPSIVAPLFAGGALRANLKVAQADREIALAQYEKAIQAAFREVSDGLIQRETLAEQLEAQRALVASLEAFYHLSSERYRAGLDGYLAVLVAQRSLYNAQHGLLATRLAVQANQITLYKALGGQR